jgi:hypothetical protein
MKTNPLAMETFDLVAHKWTPDQFEMFDAIQDAECMGEYKMAPTDFIEYMMGTYKKSMPSFATIYDQDEIRGNQWWMVVGFQVDEVHKVPTCALFPLAWRTWRNLVALELGALQFALGLVGACFPRFVHFVRLHQICVPSALSSNFSIWNPTTWTKHEPLRKLRVVTDCGIGVRNFPWGRF